jgi:hypothetical protein
MAGMSIETIFSFAGKWYLLNTYLHANHYNEKAIFSLNALPLFAC